MRTPAPLPPTTETTHLLEINLISAQNLKPPTSNLRRLQTYAVAYINPNLKLRTRIDKVGSENPNWNDKFIFRVSSEFLSRATSAVTVDIFSVGVIKDHLLGSVRFLISNVITAENYMAPQFAAAQIRRPSGRYHGVLNIGAMVIGEGEGGEALRMRVNGIGYRDMMGGEEKKGGKKRRESGGQHQQRGSSGESWEFSDGSESSASNASSSNWEERECDGGNGGGVGGSGVLCGLGFQRKVMMHASFSENDIRALANVDLNKSA